MSLSLEQKKAMVAEVASVLSGAQTVVVAEYRGLTVAQMTALRRRARDSEVCLQVVKNTLARRAVQGSQFECLQEQLVGPLAFAAGSDPVAVAKVLSEFAKDNHKLVIKTGAMNGRLISTAEIEALAKLLSRDQLLAMLIGTLQAPIQKFVQTLNEIPAKFVRTMAAVRDSKQGS